MTDRRLPDRSAIRELADRLNEEAEQKVRLTGSSTPGGRDRDTRRTGLPMPIGSEGQVVMVVDVDGNLVPQWADAPGSALGGVKYRQFLTVDDGSGGWGFVQATIGGLTRPVTALYDLE